MKRNTIIILAIAVGLAACVLLATAVGGYFWWRASSRSATTAFNVRVKLDDSRSLSSMIATTGGVVTATGADGTKFTLTIPKDALLRDEQITLTPVSEIDGLPFSGGLAGAVQMSPDGLSFLQPVTLMIESPAISSTKAFQTVGFSYSRSGEDLFPAPLKANGNRATIELWHFSGQGAAWGTTAEYIDFMRKTYDAEIAPQLPIASQDCEAAKQVIPKALSWGRAIASLELPGEFKANVDNILETLTQSIARCYDKSYDKCVKDNDESQRSVMMFFLRYATLLGIENTLDLSKIDKCPPGFRVDQAALEGHLSGWICSLSHPFQLQFVASPPGLPPGDMHGVFLFTPAGNDDGTWSYSGTAAQGIVKNTGKGRYTVERKESNPPLIQMDGGIMTHTNPMTSTSAPGKPATLQLQPAADACGKAVGTFLASTTVKRSISNQPRTPVASNRVSETPFSAKLPQ